MIQLGCSGWSYPDWVGPFYPTGKTDKLEHYTRVFNTVEINTTFYRIPDMKIYSTWIRRMSGKDFTYSIKFPGEVTHKLLLSDQGKAESFSINFEQNYIKPMENARKLGAVLIQLPPFFTLKDSGKLYSLMASLDTESVRYFIEPRHNTLIGNQEFMGEIRSLGAEITEIDGPMADFSAVDSRSSSFYLRFHGRNSEAWFRKNEDSSERYNYAYSDQQISGFASIIGKSIERYEDAFIYFNNHPQGNAPANAFSLWSKLGLKRRDPQSRLG